MATYQDNIEWENDDEEYLRTHYFAQRPYWWSIWSRFNPSSLYFWMTCAIYVGSWIAMGLMSILNGLYGFHTVHWVFIYMGVWFFISAVGTGLLYGYLYNWAADAHARVDAGRERWHRERAHRIA